jgi:hypothetical protein
MNTDQYKIQIKTPNSSILTKKVLSLFIRSRKEIDETLNTYSGDITVPLFFIGNKGKSGKEGVFIPNNLDEYHPIGNTTRNEAINAYFKHEATHYITLKLWKNHEEYHRLLLMKVWLSMFLNIFMLKML